MHHWENLVVIHKAKELNRRSYRHNPQHVRESLVIAACSGAATAAEGGDVKLEVVRRVECGVAFLENAGGADSGGSCK